MNDKPEAVSTRARILIVDDEAANVKALCDTLRNHGYETVGFTSARAALAALRESRFDLLLSDLMMPEMSGIALLTEALAADKELAGVIMTGHGTIDTAVEAMRIGALDYLLKPFKLTSILPVLARALEVRRLRSENAALQRRVLERTAELEASNRELNAFATAVAHDLNTPVRHIGAFARMLEEESSASLPASSRDYLAHVVKASDRLGHLIADLLHFSRLAHAPLNMAPVNLNQVLRAARQDIEPETQGRQIVWKIAELPTVRGDASLLQQVLCNLLSNAVKYTGRRPVAEIEVGTAVGAAGEPAIFVRDNGAGFDMAHVEKLFGVFQRLHPEEEFKGTGVGLANVRRIITRHGGRVWAEGAVERGATFYFSLPG